MAKPKKILNDPEDSVEEFIEGLLLQYPNRLRRLEKHHVVLASQRNTNAVQLISGGGSGHEPSHAGWIGRGMLTAAVCGGIFSSPSVAAVLQAIQAVGTDSSSGVLLVIKNYTGDRLNFGVAAERANNLLGVPVRTVVVADDTALPRQKGVTGARGVAGTVLVHKIAGAAAAAGRSLDDCHDVAQRVCARTGTLGIAMDAVTVPGASSVNDRLADEDTIEIGLGIHGEAGLKQSKLLTADEMAVEMVKTIQEYGRVDDATEEVMPFVKAGDEVVILVNNLGGTSNFEMSILARSCIKELEGDKYKVRVSRVLVGSYMTSFDMHGASLTILNATGAADLLEYLDASCTAPAWSKSDVWKMDKDIRPSIQRVPEAPEADGTALKQPPCQIPDFDATAKKVVQAAMTALSDAEPLLTKYDTIVGDGDCGLTMKRGATQILEELQSGKLTTSHPVPLFSAISQAVSGSMGGTSGILMELLFGKMASTLAQENEITVSALAAAFAAGVQAVQLYGGATVGSRTMLDALVPAATAWQSSTTTDVARAAQAARTGADDTASMDVASAGRSNYLNAESLQGTPDPGAVAVAIVLEACTAALK